MKGLMQCMNERVVQDQFNFGFEVECSVEEALRAIVKVMNQFLMKITILDRGQYIFKCYFSASAKVISQYFIISFLQNYDSLIIDVLNVSMNQMLFLIITHRI